VKAKNSQGRRCLLDMPRNRGIAFDLFLSQPSFTVFCFIQEQEFAG
jgi:hypothetical protein